MKKKKKKPFNPVMGKFSLIVASPPSSLKEAAPEAPETESGAPDDVELFLDTMSDVKPLGGRGRETARSGPRNTRPAHRAPDDERDGLILLRSLVDGSTSMDITFSDEYVEGAVSGVSRKIMKQLKKGHIPIQDHIDLHGLTKQEAEKEVRDFLVNSHGLGLRCVLIVHGRGLNSPDNVPVLKERLPVWLNRGPARKIVLAFASGQPYDGGTGAIYILLRR